MPQVRDTKTGRYTSGGGSSVGGAAGTNPRIQKAKAVGNGAPAGWASPSPKADPFKDFGSMTDAQVSRTLGKLPEGSYDIGVEGTSLKKFYSSGGRGSKAGNYYVLEGKYKNTLLTTKDVSRIYKAKDKAKAVDYFANHWGWTGYQD